MSFVLPRLIWLALNPLSILLALICIALLLQLTRWRRTGRRLLYVCTVFIVMLSVLPVGTLMLAALEGQYPPLRRLPKKVDGIIVLGGASQPHIAFARGQAAVNGNAERLLAFASLARRYPEAKLVFSGGRGGLRKSVLSQADVVAKIFVESGLETGRIVFESEARNTNDSPRLIRERVEPRAGETWLLVTSATHMARSLGVFRKQGWNVTAYPCDYRTEGGMRSLTLTFSIAGGLHEFAQGSRAWIGLLAYYLMGRTSALLPPALPDAT